MISDGITFDLVNVELAMNDPSVSIIMSNNPEFTMFGGSVTTTSAGVTSFISGTASGGGVSGVFTGVKMEAITGALINGMGGNATDDRIDFSFDSCALASGVDFFSEDIESMNQQIIATKCSFSSSAAEYQYYRKIFAGEAQEDSAIRRVEDEPFTESNAIISYKIVTNAKCSPANPFYFDFPISLWSELSSASTDTLRFFIASTSTLTENDVYIELIYPDGTNKQVFNFVSTRGFILDTGTELTTDSSSDWRDGGSPLAGHNEYTLDVSTSGDVGADSYPTVRVYAAKASVTIQLASEPELI